MRVGWEHMDFQTSPVAISPIEIGFRVAVNGPIHTNTTWIEREFDKVVAAKPRQVELDLLGCEHVSSVGLGILVNFHNRLKGQGSAMRIIKMRPHMRDILRAAYLHRFFDIAPDAVANVQAK